MNRPFSGLNKFLRRIPLHLAVILMCLVWLLPTVGLFVTSFREFADVNETGWWMATAPPKGTSDYQLFCSSCHGTEGKMIPETDLSDPEVISKLRRSYHLAATFGTEYNGQVHVPEEDRPNERQTADIVAYLKRLSGLDTREFPTLSNYVDALTGFVGAPGDTYLEAVERGPYPRGEEWGRGQRRPHDPERDGPSVHQQPARGGTFHYPAHRTRLLCGLCVRLAGL